MSLAIFEDIVCIWPNFAHTMTSFYAFEQTIIVVNDRYDFLLTRLQISPSLISTARVSTATVSNLTVNKPSKTSALELSTSLSPLISLPAASTLPTLPTFLISISLGALKVSPSKVCLYLGAAAPRYD